MKENDLPDPDSPSESRPIAEWSPEKRSAEVRRRIDAAIGNGKALDLCECDALEDLSALSGLTQLESLTLSRCRALKDVSALSALTQLQSLDLSACFALKDVSVLSGLTQLKSLHLSEHEALKDVSGLSALTQLQSLDLRSCRALKDVSALSGLTQLKSLDLAECKSLKDVSALSGLTQLVALDLSGCEALKDRSALSGLKQLQALNLGWCTALKDLSALSGLTQLVALNLSWCTALKDLSILSGLKQLVSLELTGCSALKDVSALSGLTQLQSLDLTQCEALKDVSVLSGMTQLVSLDLTGCRALEDLSALSGLTQLQSLDLTECAALKDVSALSGLTQLQSLDLTECEALKDLSALSGLTQLQSLDLSGCSALKDVSDLSGLTQLQSLELTGCRALKDVGVLSGLTQLKSLDLSGNKTLKNLSVLSGLKQLKSLALSGCKALEDLSALSGLAHLQSLALSVCEALKDLSVLSGLIQLVSLDLSGYKALKDLSALSGLTQLQSLDLSWCEALKDVSVLSGLTQLQSLDLSGCALKDLSALSGLKQLKRLELTGCRELEDLSALSELTNLESLDLMACSGRLRPLRHLIEGLSRLILYDGDFTDVPREICGTHQENVRDAVVGYYCALDEQAAVRLSDAKVLIVGNGRAGKTTLTRRLRRESLNLLEPTTHGIRVEAWITEFEPSDAPAGSSPEPVTLNLWDFGGQDLYHHTHRLFFQGASVFVVVWTAERPPLEAATVAEENPFRPLAFWLDQVCSLNPGAQIVIVRNRRAGEKANTAWKSQVSPRLRREAQLLDAGSLDLHAATEADVQRVRDRIVEAVAHVLGSRGRRERPKGWVALAHNLSARQTRYSAALDSWERGGKVGFRPSPETPVMNREEFKILVREHCRKVDGTPASDTDDPETLLTWLHGTGIVYWQPKKLGGRILIEQRWAIEGIYGLLDRATHGPDRLHASRGLFSPTQVAAWCWQAAGYSADEQELFLEFMKACGFAVEVLRGDETLGGEPLMLAPYFLPEADSPEAALPPAAFTRRHGEVEFEKTFEHSTLGRDTAQAFLVSVVRTLSRSANVWKYGANFSDAARRARALVSWEPLDGNDDNFGGEFAIKVLGQAQAAEELFCAICDEIEQLAPLGTFHTGKAVAGRLVAVRGTILRGAPEGTKGARYHRTRVLRKIPHEVGEAGERGQFVTSEVAHAGATIDGLASVAGARAERVGWRISISCATQSLEEPGIEEAPARLHRKLMVEGLNAGPVIYYRATLSESDINGLTAEIAKADFRVVFLSRRYLYSRFCMAELLLLYSAPTSGSLSRDRCLLLRFPSAAWVDSDWTEWRKHWRMQGAVVAKKIATYVEEGDGAAGAAASAMVGNFVNQWLGYAESAHRLRQLEAAIVGFGRNQARAPVHDSANVSASRVAIDRWLAIVLAEMKRHLPRSAGHDVLLGQLREGVVKAWRDGDHDDAKILYRRYACAEVSVGLGDWRAILRMRRENEMELEMVREACLADGENQAPT